MIHSLLTFLLVFILSIGSAFAQMDSKFYHPDKESIPIDSLNYEDIFIPVDNDTIHSIFVKADKPAKATVFYFHGNGANISKWANHIKILSQNGYQVYMLDYRGYGKSTGIPTHLNIAHDAQIAFDSIMKRNDVAHTPIIIYGASIGTQVASHIARNNNDRISALVVDGMMASFTDVALATSPPEYHQQIKEMLISPYSAKEDIPQLKNIKILFIHSPQDFIPIAQSEEIYNNCKTAKTFWTYEGAHVMAPLLYPATFISYINALLEP